MKEISIFLIALFTLGCSLSAEVDSEAAKQVVQRRIGNRAADFVFETIQTDADTFEIEGRGKKVVLRGNTPVSQAAAFNWYLKHVANCQISWNGDQLDLPKRLPVPAEKIRKKSPYQWRHYYNYCTLSYAMAFKDWQDWEREIDIMALRGVNMALVLPGHEKVWQNVLKRLGYSQEDIAAFIPTSAHTAWWLMANLEGVSGAVPQDIIDGEAALGRKIIDRMKQLGIEPIVNSFFGMVPSTFKKYYPDAAIIPQGNWGAGVRPVVLSPMDPMFSKVSKIWYEELDNVFGKVNYFGGDLFHEGGNTGHLPLGECAVRVQREMLRYNPAATWVMMSWQVNPRQEMLETCDKDHLLIQQLAYSIGDWQRRGYWGRLRTFEGAPWTLSFILNFGGSEAMVGNLRSIAEVPDILKQREDLKECIGLGMMCEGTQLNPINYDMISDLSWMDSAPDVDQWLKDYVTRRYGKTSESAFQAWQILERSVYRFPPDLIQEGQTDSILCGIPSKTITQARHYGGNTTYWSFEEVLKAAELLLAAGDELRDEETYRYDLVDVTRQVLQDYARVLHPAMIEAYEMGDKAAFNKRSDDFLRLADDTDRLLGTNRHFLLGNWLQDARDKASTDQGKRIMEHSARFLITHWSDRSDRNLSDYSNRQWAGLIKDYYKPRWEFFIQNLKDVMDDSKRAGEIEKRYWDQYRQRERRWIDACGTAYATKAKGDSIETASEILKKYAPLVRNALNEKRLQEQQKRYWSWDLSQSNDAVQLFSWDVYSQIQSQGPGRYSIVFQWRSGQSALEIDYVELVQDGKVLAVDEHAGWTGVENRENTYYLNLEAMPATVAPYYLRARVHGASGNDSRGEIVFRKMN